MKTLTAKRIPPLSAPACILFPLRVSVEASLPVFTWPLTHTSFSARAVNSFELCLINCTP